MTPSIDQDKLALRAQLRARRDAFFAGNPDPIATPDAFRERLAPDSIVASYIPIGSEADPVHLIRAAIACGCRLALPYVTDRAAPIRFLAWEPDAPLTAGPFGLRQPDAGSAELNPDMILTPLVGFDARLNRLGQGAAHYDRAFARFGKAWRVGVAWSVQEVPAIPADIWDVPLHAIITEKGMTWHKEA